MSYEENQLKSIISGRVITILAAFFALALNSEENCLAQSSKPVPRTTAASHPKKPPSASLDKLRAGIKSGNVMPIEKNWKMPRPSNLPATDDAKKIEVRNRIPSTSSDYLQMLNKSSRTMAANPNDAGAYLDASYAYRNLGQFEEALKNCKKAIELNPDLPVAHSELGLVNASLGNNTEAIKNFTRAIELDPQNSAFYSHRAWMYAAAKKEDLAIAEATKSIQIWDGYSPAYYCRGRAYLEKAEWQKAIDDFSRAIKLFPDQDSDYYSSRAYAYFQLSDFRNALLDLILPIRMESQTKHFNIFQQVALLHPDSFQKTLLDLNFRVLKNKKDANALLNRAIAYSLVREYDKALSDLDAASKLAPKNGTIHRERGLVFLQTGRISDAVSELNQAIKLDPEDQSAKNRLLSAKALLAKPGKISKLEVAKVMSTKPATGSSLRPAESVEANVESQSEAQEVIKKYVANLAKENLREHLPERADFDKQASRDLIKYFERELNRKISVEVELLSDVPSPTFGGLPTIYCWVKVKDGPQLLKEGVAILTTQNKHDVLVQSFFTGAQVKANPDLVRKKFPHEMVPEILFRAGLRAMPKPITR
jgi:tetratricopeptide (TPR) repeat protein